MPKPSNWIRELTAATTAEEMASAGGRTSPRLNKKRQRTDLKSASNRDFAHHNQCQAKLFSGDFEWNFLQHTSRHNPDKNPSTRINTKKSKPVWAGRRD
jgi:hypothetical protein